MGTSLAVVTKHVKNVIAVALGTFFIIALVSGVDRLWFVNGSSYPVFATKEDVSGRFSVAWINNQRAQCSRPLEIHNKTDNRTFIRCGFGWPFAITWIADTNAVKQAGFL